MYFFLLLAILCPQKFAHRMKWLLHDELNKIPKLEDQASYTRYLRMHLRKFETQMTWTRLLVHEIMVHHLFLNYSFLYNIHRRYILVLERSIHMKRFLLLSPIDSTGFDVFFFNLEKGLNFLGINLLVVECLVDRLAPSRGWAWNLVGKFWACSQLL